MEQRPCERPDSDVNPEVCEKTCMSWGCGHGLKPINQNLSEAIKRQVQGALRSCINAHGPITKNLIGSVLKRLEGQPEYRRLTNDKN